MPTSSASSRRRPARTQGRRHGRLLALGLVVFWIAVAAAAGPLAAKLAAAETDSNAAFLPRGAEATRALALQRQFAPVPTVSAVVLWERPSGLTEADRAAVSAAAGRFAGVPGVVGQPSPPTFAADGQAGQVVVRIQERKQAEIGESVKALKAAARAGDLKVYIAGEAGLTADFADVLSSVDTTLLMVTGLVVIVVLVLVYRSPVLWIAPLASVGVALALAQGIIYLLVRYAGASIDVQSASILMVLAFGAGTDYALLLIARYREELRRHESNSAAMSAALRGSGVAIVASGLTVSASLLCLLASQLTSNRALGIVASIGIACTVLATMTFLPALLLLLGRWLFWPAVPRHTPGEGESTARGNGVWRAAGRLVDRRPVVVAGVITVVLGGLALGMTQLRAGGIAQTEAFTQHADSATAQQVLARHMPGGAGSPAIVIADAAQADAVAATAKGVRGVAGAEALPGTAGSGTAASPRLAQVVVTLADAPDSQAALATVDRLRAALAGLPEAHAKVGGESAILLDLQDAATRDRNVIIPFILAVIFVILLLLLRSVVAPIMVMATVVLSFLATLGVSAFVFNHVFHFAGADPAFPLFAFTFLVALGVDYNIFLMSRVREDTPAYGTRKAVTTALVATGGVITSAGLVLAATFATLGVLPLVFFATIGFSVAFGVLLDTLVVRSLLVPALAIALRRWLWWPARPAGAADADAPPSVPGPRRMSASSHS